MTTSPLTPGRDRSTLEQGRVFPPVGAAVTRAKRPIRRGADGACGRGKPDRRQKGCGSMLDLKVVNGTLVIPGTGLVWGGVGCKDGKIVSIGPEAGMEDAVRTVDAAGKYVLPGVIDPHVHLGIFTGDFGLETENETRAALAGGITTVGVFMGGDQSYLGVLPGLIETVEAKSSTDLFFHLSMFISQQLDEIPQY